MQNEAVRQWLHHCKLTAVYRNSFGDERVDLRLTQICDLALKRKFPKAKEERIFKLSSRREKPR